MKRKVKYEKILQGSPVLIPTKKNQGAWAIKCCDCGLEHVVLFKTDRKDALVASVWRMDDINAAETPSQHYKAKPTNIDSKRTLKAKDKRRHG